MALVYVEGRLRVCRRMCDTCIFRAGNLMQLRPGRVEGMVEEATADIAGNIPCHHTLEQPLQAVCRGFWDRHPTGLLRLAAHMGIVQYVDPHGEEAG